MDLFNLRAVIGLDTSEYERGIKSSSGLFTKVGRGFKTTAKAIGKTVAVGVGAGAAAFAALAKASLDAHGELEQNIGGSEAVFKEFADFIQDEGALAYKNLGLSQSDYLATANKMGALLQGSGYSIAESFGLTTEVMQRAADVASIMGLDTSAAMEAIAGAAKGNFTMMDNLGVAINDAALAEYALSQGITKSTQEMTTQEKVGLAMELFLENTAYAAGNYARENETLAGSLSTAKAAFDNFLSGAGTAEQLVDAVLGSAQVIITNLSTLLPALAEGIGSLIAGLAPMLPDLILQLLPAIVNGAVTLLDGLIAALPEVLAALTAALPYIVQAIADMLPSLITALVDATVLVLNTLAAQAPELVPIIIDALLNAILLLIQNAPALIEAGVALITGLITGLVNSIPLLVEQAPVIIDALVAALGTLLQGVVDVGASIIAALVTGITGDETSAEDVKTFFTDLWDDISTSASNAGAALITILSDAWTAVSTSASDLYTNVTTWFSDTWTDVSTYTDGLWTDVTTAWSNGESGVAALASTLWTDLNTWFSSIYTDLTGSTGTLWEDLGTAWDGISTTIGTAAESAWTSATDWFTDLGTDITDSFDTLWTDVTTVWDNIKTAIQTPIEEAKTIVSDAITAIIGFFDFDFSWPDLKLPHFSFSGSWNPFDWPEEFPSIGVEWYNKAMNNPMLLRGATIFGMQDGRMLGGGDAGGEIVAGANTVVQMITDAVHSALSSGNLGGVVVNQNIYSEAKTAADLMQEARWEAERAVLTSV